MLAAPVGGIDAASLLLPALAPLSGAVAPGNVVGVAVLALPSPAGVPDIEPDVEPVPVAGADAPRVALLLVLSVVPAPDCSARWQPVIVIAVNKDSSNAVLRTKDG